MTMKKAPIIALSIVLSATSLFAQPVSPQLFSIKAGGTYFYPAEESMKNIYGNGSGWGGEINIKLWRFIDLWMFGNSFEKAGSLPYTREPTKISLITYGGGIKFRFTAGRLSFYLGGGPAACYYKENNAIGQARGTDPGFVGQLGLYVRIIGGLILDVAADYASIKAKPKTIEADLGGARAAVRIGYVY